jgi:hypothetical protein
MPSLTIAGGEPDDGAERAVIDVAGYDVAEPGARSSTSRGPSGAVLKR